jgi:group I intron endonuclease
MLESYKNVSGIYAIVNLKDGKRYVGSAVCLRRRARQHIAHLERGSHFNRHLQSAWKRDGAASFQFEVLEIVSDALLLLSAEQRHMDEAKGNRYNLRPMAHSNQGIKWPEEFKKKVSAGLTGKKQSEETRKRRSDAMKGRCRCPIAAAKTGAKLRGRSRPDVKGYSSEANRKFTDTQVCEIRKLRESGLTYRALAEQYNCSPSTILFVVKGKGVCYSG